MLKQLARLTVVALVSTLGNAAAPQKVAAQTYQIDCAILLCLSGGWPASAPCTRAHAEFIRRITPWPVEPPLQIWRCPMGVAYQQDDGDDTGPSIYDILFDGTRALPQSFPFQSLSSAYSLTPAVLRQGEDPIGQLPEGFALHLAQDRADIDISGPEFNFVRSIRVFDVRHTRQYQAGSEGDCNRSANIFLGTYGTQGDFSWAPSSPTALPECRCALINQILRIERFFG